MTTPLYFTCATCGSIFDFLGPENPDLDRCRPCKDRAERKPEPVQLEMKL